ncbi:MAG: hypothetical protein A2256_02885 [Candidatus Staskawiczbacteria bacterium RIFOXYA2_FULL_32_7]|nr:MAG: hypothetical protein A2256_02885 [Candidatus Staskawiczbacteria bacterium RIFOXYA2_FULL_32_7]
MVKLSNDKKEEEKEIVLIGKEKDEYAELGRGLAEYNQKLYEKRELAKSKILEMFKTKTKISNREIANVLSISITTTRRYLDDLESEKKIKQIGKTGKKVIYTLI